MTATFATQIELDGDRVPWISNTKVKVAEVVLDKIAWAWSPEEIHFQHPHLSLAQIYAALNYYEKQAALDAQIRKGLADSESAKAALSDVPFRRRLTALKHSH